MTTIDQLFSFPLKMDNLIPDFNCYFLIKSLIIYLVNQEKISTNQGISYTPVNNVFSYASQNYLVLEMKNQNPADVNIAMTLLYMLYEDDLDDTPKQKFFSNFILKKGTLDYFLQNKKPDYLAKRITGKMIATPIIGTRSRFSKVYRPEDLLQLYHNTVGS